MRAPEPELVSVLSTYYREDVSNMDTPTTHSELERLFQHFEQSPPRYRKNYLAERRTLLDLSESFAHDSTDELAPDEINPAPLQNQVEQADTILLEAIELYQWDTDKILSFVDSPYGVAFATDVLYATGKKTYDIVTSFQYLLRVVQ